MNRLKRPPPHLWFLPSPPPVAPATASCRPAGAVEDDDDRRQQLFVAGRGRYRVLRSAAPGQSAERRDHHRLVQQPAAPGERVKLTVAVLDPDLRADALRVSAARQVNQNGAWVDAPVPRPPSRSLKTSS